MSEFTTVQQIEQRITVLLEQRKLSFGTQTSTINQEITSLRENLKATDPNLLPISKESQTATNELDDLLSSFSKIRITAKSHRLRGSNATDEEKQQVEEDMNHTLDQVAIAKAKKNAHKAGYAAATDAELDPFLTLNTSSQSRTGICHDTTGTMRLHRNPYDQNHPECPGRIISIMEAVRATGLYSHCVDIPGRKATVEEILTVHSTKHIETVEKLRDANYRAATKNALGAESVYANEHTVEAAYLSCGASLAMTDAVVKGTYISEGCEQM